MEMEAWRAVLAWQPAREEPLALAGLALRPVGGAGAQTAKVELALAKGKKLYDKREDAARRDAKREMDRASRGRY